MVKTQERAMVLANSHVPVLLKEVVEFAQPKPGDVILDGTLGLAGHAKALLMEAGPHGRLIGLDADPAALALARDGLEQLSDSVLLVEANFRHMKEVIEDLGFNQVNCILLDLGMSTMQLQSPGRGFSFQRDEQLDMRFSPQQRITASDIVNTCPEQAIADIIFQYGEEPQSRRIARHIVANRPITSTGQLAGIVASAIGRRGRVHPATRVFQALRIAVNDELVALKDTLPQAVELLSPGGRLAVISFHSLEDRIVKEYFSVESRGCVCPPEAPFCICDHVATLRVLTRRPVRPTPDEISKNPASRSARLRVAIKI